MYYKKARNKEKIVLSEEFSKKLIEDTHEKLCYIGINQMKNKILPYDTAVNISENIKKTCKYCEICMKNKSRGQDKIGLMSYLGPARKPFEIVSIDTIGGFGGSRSTKKYLHLLVDHFTRFAYILTSKTQNANDFIKLTENVLKDHDIQIVLTDQYPGINSIDFKNFLKEKGVTIIFTGVNTLSSNGLNERLNQTLVNKIRCAINEKKKQVCMDNYSTYVHKSI